MNNIIDYLSSNNIFFTINNLSQRQKRGDLSLRKEVLFSNKLLNDQEKQNIIDLLSSKSEKTEYIDGYINFFLKEKTVEEIENYLFDDFFLKEKKKVFIEYASFNPTALPHLGNFRCLVFGKFLSDLFKFVGYEVFTEYYVNDIGKQIKEVEKWEETSYKQTKLIIKDKNNWINEIILLIKEEIKKYNVEFDNWIFESNFYKNIQYKENILNAYYEKHIIKDENGRMKFVLNKENINEYKYLEKEDLSPTYFQSDLHYLLYKKQINADLYVNITGSDHDYYNIWLSKAAESIGINNFDMVSLSMVKFIQDNTVHNFAKRTNFVLYPQDYMLDMLSMRMLFLSYHNNKSCIISDAILENNRKHVLKIKYIKNNLNKKDFILNMYRLKKSILDCLTRYDTSSLMVVIKEFSEYGYSEESSLKNILFTFLDKCIYS